MTANKTPTAEELWQLVQDQRDEMARQRNKIERLEVRLSSHDGEGGQKVPQDSMQSRKKRGLSRAGLLKLGAASVVGVAGAELVGSLGAQPAWAAGNYEAAGAKGDAFYQPGDTTGYGYDNGVYVYGQSYGVHAEAKDTLGNPNNGTGVLGGTGSGYGVVGYSGFSGEAIFGTTVGIPPVTRPNTGVHGASAWGVGVYGESNSSNGVHGYSSSGVGVLGQATQHSQLPPAGTNVGVYGTGAGRARRR